jgi:phosphonoacetaldehyde hydrolase
MQFRYRRSYQGPLQALIVDWAGTVVDYGCMAPAAVFIEVFRREGVEITMAEAREPMGAHKRTHVAEIAAMPAVAGRWRAQHGGEPSEADVDRMYANFIPLQLECLSQYSALIPGVLDVTDACRRRGMKIGSTTGYDRDMLAINLADAARQGFEPDASFCASDVPQGRPLPHMALQNVIALDVETVAACVKVDDTVPGIEEGLNAGMWSIGLAVCGNEFGLPEAQVRELPAETFQRRRNAVYRKMYQCGSHYVVDSIGDILPCLDDIQARLARGEQP